MITADPLSARRPLLFRSGFVKRHLCLFLGLACLLIGCHRGKDAPFLLQEGKGWEGGLSLGDSGEEVVRRLGKPPKQQEEKAWRYYDYDFAEIMIEVKTGKVVSILLRRNWRTASGVAEGDFVEKIQETYGQIPYRPPILSYPQQGVSFVLAPGEVAGAEGSKRPGWRAIWVRIYKPER